MNKLQETIFIKNYKNLIRNTDSEEEIVEIYKIKQKIINKYQNKINKFNDVLDKITQITK
tara:strand:+ start:775 stop:954 length:180 start_codon:yes stop_codon:yes gene_type:complete